MPVKDLLQVVTRGGSGSAARTLSSGLAGFLRRVRRVPLLLGAVVVLSLLGWTMLSDMTTKPTPTAATSTSDLVTPIATPIPEASSAIDISDRVAYAMDLSEIAGLSAEVPPGSSIELWAIWDRPVTRSPELQLVVRDAILEKISHPTTPDGPTVATFLVSENQVDRLLWADRYGAISATMPVP